MKNLEKEIFIYRSTIFTVCAVCGPVYLLNGRQGRVCICESTGLPLTVQEDTAVFPSVLSTTEQERVLGIGQVSFFGCFASGFARLATESKHCGGRRCTAQWLFSKVTRQQGCATHPGSTRRGLSGEIFPSADAQAADFIILSLARPRQCHRAAERDKGNISEMRFSTQGSDGESHSGGDVTAARRNL